MIKYIIGHHTAGNYTPCDVDLNSYQKLITGDGVVMIGTPQGQTCSTAGMNSITYNIACCGGLMRTPITEKQAERFYYVCALELKRLNLSPANFYTHAEIGEMCTTGEITRLLPHNKWLKDNIGKIDLKILPGCSGSAKQTGDYIRQRIKEIIRII